VLLAVDFDGTIVLDDRAYDDLVTPLEFVLGARDALYALRRAGHVLLLYSARANRALREDPALDPLVRAGLRRVDRGRWSEDHVLHEARYRQMCDFVARELPGVFAAIDDGQQGKPDADMFIDDRAITFGHDGAAGAVGWESIARAFGEPLPPVIPSPHVEAATVQVTRADVPRQDGRGDASRERVSAGRAVPDVR
jgi:hypothetical protein